MSFPEISEEDKRKLELSENEITELNERTILCPKCGFKLGEVFSDASGHIKIKCQKCKFVGTLNLSYFKIWKPNRRYKYWK